MNIKKYLHPFIPKPIISGATQVLLRLFRIWYPNLTIRPDSTDSIVFRDNLLLNRLRIDLRNPKVIIDAGAYVGYQSLYFARKYPSCLVIAIEPDPKNYERLLLHTKNFDNIKTLNAALWPTESKIGLRDRGTGEWGYTVDTERGTVPTVTVEQILNKFGVDRIDLIKIDIEGSERFLFKDKIDWISRTDNIVIELHDRIYPDCTTIVEQALANDVWTYRMQGEKRVYSRT